jgi:lipoprotein-anchoring transpeptidase ErfK/SrfK
MMIRNLGKAITVAGLALTVLVGSVSAGTAAQPSYKKKAKRVTVAAVQQGNQNSGGDVPFFGDVFGGGMSGGAQTVSFSPRFAPGQVVVSFGDRRLYLVQARGQARAYPIAIPKAEARWAGSTFVSQKRVNPPWTPTPTMRAQNSNLPSYVPGGHPMNPMGIRALYLGSSTYRIHGTDAPWTIGTAASKGCIRMFNEDVVDLYSRVPVGARVLVTWDRFTS